MHLRRFLSLALGLAVSLSFGSLPVASAAPPSHSIDEAHSRVGFKVRHKMVSWVAGQFDSFSGTIDFDPGDVEATRVKVQIDPASINTSNAKRDRHLKSADFFDVATYPAMSFESTGIEKIAKDGSFTVVGNLTMHGVTAPVELLFGPVSNLVGGKRGVNVTGSLNRQDFGISWSKLLDTGGLVVGNTIRFDFDLELNVE
jgi:polyisoprenoid-binding protein YceI